MAQNFLTPKIIAMEVLAHLENEAVLGNMVSRDYDKEFSYVGETVTVRKPVRFLGQEDNTDITGYREEIQSGLTTVEMNKTLTIPFDISAKDRTLSVKDSQIQELHIKPAVIRMKDRIEASIGALTSELFHFSGTPGLTPSGMEDLGDAGVILTEQAVPEDDRCGFHNPRTSLKLATGLSGVFVQGIAKTALEKASFGNYAGFDNYKSVHIPSHTVGDYGGTPLINGADQATTYALSKETNTQTIVTDGWTSDKTSLLRKGDVFTIQGVNAVNPVSKLDTGALQHFVVKSDANSDGTGNSTVTICPAMIADGAYQNVTAAPADNAVITVVTGAANTTYKQSVMMHKNAFTFVSRPLTIPDTSFKTHTVSGNRMSISVSEGGDFNTLAHRFRLDMLWGVKCIYPELGVRLTA